MEQKKMGYFALNPENAREAGRKGGKEVSRKFDHEHFERIGRMGGLTVSRNRGPDFFREIGRKGGIQKGLNRKNKETS